MNTNHEYNCRNTTIEKGEFYDIIKEEQEFIDQIWPQNCGDSLRIISNR